MLPAGEKVTVPAQQVITVELWGPLNTYVTSSQELTVEASPSDAARVKRSILPIHGNVRKWEITGLRPTEVTIAAKAGSQTWCSFVLNVKPASWVNLTPEKMQFLDDLADQGREALGVLPLSAMLACAGVESLYGTSLIYQHTHNPFNLQKPDEQAYPICQTIPQCTFSTGNEAHCGKAPFCTATSLTDAVRQWREWIENSANIPGRNVLMGLTGSPRAFAENLYRVGFANNEKARTAEYGVIWQQYKLGDYD